MADDEKLLVDTGPLVAIVNARDASHKTCADILRDCRLPLLTTWPVITEAAWLLRNVPQGVSKLLGMVESGIVECLELDADAAAWISHELERYADLKPQFADVSLLYIAAQEDLNEIFTLDRRDFVVY